MQMQVYTFTDRHGVLDSYTTQDARAARERGKWYGLRVTAHTYEWADSETAWDFTGTEEEG